MQHSLTYKYKNEGRRADNNLSLVYEKKLKKVYQLYELSIYFKDEELMFFMLMFFETNVNKI